MEPAAALSCDTGERSQNAAARIGCPHPRTHAKKPIQHESTVDSTDRTREPRHGWYHFFKDGPASFRVRRHYAVMVREPTKRKELVWVDRNKLEQSARSLPRNFSAFLSSLRKADRDGLFSTLDPPAFATLSGPQGSFFLAVHCALH